MSARLCANCVERPATHRGPVERGGPVFDLCDDCELPAVEGHGIERGYEAPGGLPTAKEADAGVRRAMGDARYERDADIDRRFGQKPSRSTSDEFDEFLSETFRRHRTGAWAQSGRRR